MSSEVITRVRARNRKAEELQGRGHNLRAAENYGLAAEAARALHPGADNLIQLDMRLSQAAVMVNYLAVAQNAVDPVVLSAQCAECVSLLSGVVAALERRRVAGTLLEGKCTADEEAGYAAELRECRFSSDEAASRAKLVGLHVVFRAGFYAWGVLVRASFVAEECSAPQLLAYAQHVVHAADLMQLPRSRNTVSMGAEVSFAGTVTACKPVELAGSGLDASLVRLLVDARVRLQQSGVLETRRILTDSRNHNHNEAIAKHEADVRAALTAPGLRSCALAGCGAREAHPKHFKRCSACQTVVYCSKEHQLEAWPAHKAACKAARKAAASADGGAGAGAAS